MTYKTFKARYAEGEDMMRSEPWILSGAYGNCWDDEIVELEPDKTPDFDKFEALLEEVSKGITHVQFKELYAECVTTEDVDEYGYYGSYTNERRYVCDVKKLYDSLVKMGVVKK